MLQIQLPHQAIEIKHIVLDFNGTLALDGVLLPGVKERLQDLGKFAELHVFTADTFGSAARECAGLPVKMVRVNAREGGADKARLVKELGAQHTAAVGNGHNDALMFKEAALSLLVLGEEGAAMSALMAAHIVFPSIIAALDFLLKPQRAVATLRP
ncbi:Soluble P-type ATPase [Thermanaeromonas toyohensis ToBE]|uniref:Soluble P-type ATPase n=1 Tax=Thermanaeromonas toyohensis ToBE TaxID=698762 RepID=A0A1W1W2T0_9FIRM|nr:HAD family hydrolase [Thermanaeromonas toyohensis]SMB99780.1 Soluble P-type ATPase [Thermanaeromonas toyohensis ToBE]